MKKLHDAKKHKTAKNLLADIFSIKAKKENHMSAPEQSDKAALKAQAKADKEAAKAQAKADKLAVREAAKAEMASKVREPRNTMAKAWGETFHRAATENLDQSQVQQIMLGLFPNKEETIMKWTGWYKNFYNMGRIKGFENPVKVNWRDANAEAKAQAREAKKAEKAAARDEAKQAKIAAKEEARVEKLRKKKEAKELAGQTK